MENKCEMRDAIGQRISPGDIVAHVGMGHAKVSVYEVKRLTKKRIVVEKSTTFSDETFLQPQTLINVTANMKIERGECVLLSVETHNNLIADSVRKCEYCGHNINGENE